MVDVFVKDVPVGRFFATADQPPANVFVMRVLPCEQYIGKAKKGQRREKRKFNALCQRIDDGEYVYIEGGRMVRLIAVEEHDKTTFYV